MKRYLQFFLGVISIILSTYFYHLQDQIYVTTWYALGGYIFLAAGILILGDLQQKNFFSKTSLFINKIYGWRNGKIGNILNAVDFWPFVILVLVIIWVILQIRHWLLY